MVVIEYKSGILRLLDQRLLPEREEYVECRRVEDVACAIRELVVRGAPLIGISAGYGVCVGLHQYKTLESFDYILNALRNARPTAYNTFAVLKRIESRVRSESSGDFDYILCLVEEEASKVHKEDREMCERIAKNGQKVLTGCVNVVTICNTGMLATGGIGTALGVVYKGFWEGRVNHVFVLETRPLMQGARITMYELMKNGVPCTLITDNMAAFLFSRVKVDLAIVGADRIVRNGDTANKIGTFSLAVLCKHFGIPFYVAAPHTTIDLSLEDGSQIPIEYRGPDEVRFFRGQLTAPRDASVWNPAFDVTPAELITGIITDKGVFNPREIANVFVASKPQ